MRAMSGFSTAKMTSVPSTATVTTATESRALVITAQNFKSLLERSPAIQRRILHSFSERLAPHVI